MSASHARSHSRSQPMTTRPDLQPHAVRNILKNVESHVRLMSHLENISVSSSYTALRLRGPPGAAASTAASSSSAEPTQTEGGYSQCAQSQPRPGGAEDAASSVSTAGSTWSDPFAVTRVHRGTPTQQFYDEVVAPCVANSLSGQSYVFLVNGPPESGRSQTLYGSPHQSECGLVELTAADLIARIQARQRVLEMEDMVQTQEGPDKTTAATTSATVAPGQHGGVSPADATSAGGITVTHSAFITRGAHAIETISGEPVPLVAFPPPLGNVPLPHMRLLDPTRPPSAAVLIPDSKHVDTSCLIQFHVYAPVDSSGKRSMATLTFIDVAAIRVPLCREVAHLVETVRRVAGVSTDGSDPRFQDYCLTQVLESALVGYVTLVNITTISGRQDLFASSCAALSFASDIHRIHQVLMLIHIQAPKWLFDAARSLEQLRVEREHMLDEDYAAGVRDYYRTVSAWLTKHVEGVGGDLERLLQETAAIRQHIADEVVSQCKDLEEQLSLEKTASMAAAKDAKAAHATSVLQFDELHRLDAAISDLEKTASQSALQSGHRISEIRLEISSLEATQHNRQMELEALRKEESLYAGKTREVLSVLDKYAEDICYAQCAFSSYTELDALTRKRQRLESDLALASKIAHRQTHHYQQARERRSQLSRLTILQQRVDALRDSVRATSHCLNLGPTASGGSGVAASSSSRGVMSAVGSNARGYQTNNDKENHRGHTGALPSSSSSLADGKRDGAHGRPPHVRRAGAVTSPALGDDEAR